MSADERDRSHLIRRTVEKTLTQREAAERLDIGVRQFKRLVRAWKGHGDAALVGRQRGRAALWKARLARSMPEPAIGKGHSGVAETGDILVWR